MIQYSVTVPPRVAAGLRRLAAASPSGECTGALIGTAERGCIEVRTVIPVPEARADCYGVEPETLVRLQRQAASVRLQVIGFFRSGSTRPATPAPADVERAHAGMLYLTVHPHDGRLQAWCVRDDGRGFTELPIPLLAGAA